MTEEIQIGKIYKIKECEIRNYTNIEYLHHIVPLVVKNDIVTYLSLYNGTEGNLFADHIKLRYCVVDRYGDRVDTA